MVDHVAHVGAQNLDGDLVAAIFHFQAGKVDLGDRGGGNRVRVKFGKHLAGRAAISLFNFGQGQM